ncbi:MAG: PEP/pyruvate-binding domain-containing protein, partial [Microthrixaceae bacterium]
MSARPADDADGATRPFLSLDDPAATAAEVVGGKFASLAALRRELARIGGAQVPDAYVLPVGAAADHDAAAVRAALAVVVRRLLGAGDDTLLAVRSSAGAEDGDVASHAGVYDSVLGRRDAAGVHDALRQVLDSAGSARAAAYRSSSMEDGDAAMAVIVQRQVRADLGGWSGVVFTRDPDTGADVVLVEAVAGLGAPLVGGAVDPLRWRDPGSGPVRIDAGAQVATPAAATPAAASADRTRHVVGPPTAAVEELVRIGRALSARRGHALDLEWSIDGRDGSLALVQARPLHIAAASARASASSSSAAPTGDGEGDPTPIVAGLAVGRGVVTGAVLVVEDPDEVDD